jgi:hypothetical protein
MIRLPQPRILVVVSLLILAVALSRLPSIIQPPISDPLTPDRSTQAALTLFRQFFFLLILLIFGLTILMSKPQAAAGERQARSIGVWLGGFAACVLLVGIANFLLNPWGMYPYRLIEPRLEYTRDTKTALFSALPAMPEVLVLGTSRSMGISPAYIEAQTGATAFNAAVLSGRPSDYLALYRFMTVNRSGEAPQVLLVEINHVVSYDPDLTAMRSPARLFPYLPLPIQQRYISLRLEGLLSLQHLAEGVYALRYQQTYPLQGHWEEWEIGPDGGSARPEVTDLAQVLAPTLIQRRIPCDEAGLQQNLQALEDLIRLAEAQGTAVIFFAGPYHPDYYEAVLKDSAEFDHCKTRQEQALAAFSADYQDVTYLDYTQLSSIGGVATEQGFYDQQHTTPLNAAKLIDAAADVLRAALDR